MCVSRNLVGKILSKEFRNARPDLAKTLLKKKMPNCGCLAVKVDFGLPLDECIVDVQMLFGTQIGTPFSVVSR